MGIFWIITYCTSKGLSVQTSSKAFNAQGDVSEPYLTMTELAIPDPA